MKEYSKGIYVKFKPEEVEILHDRMKEAGVQNMSAYIRKMALNGYVIIPEWPDLNRVISLHTRIEGDIVLDCFGGSGATAIAARHTNRRCISIELEEKWSNYGIERIKEESYVQMSFEEC